MTIPFVGLYKGYLECPLCGYIFRVENHLKRCNGCKEKFSDYELSGKNVREVKKKRKKGSRTMKERGYVMVEERLPLHRKLLMDMGIDLTGLQVHHINRIKTDNRLENLYICTWEEHRKIHCGKLPNPTESNVFSYL